MKTVLLCLDASLYGRSVVDHGAWIAGRLGAAVDLLHAVEKPAVRQAEHLDLSGSLGVGERERLLEAAVEVEHARRRAAHEQGRVLLDQAREALRAAGVAEVRTTLRNGSLVDVVKELEDGADLIVLGKRGEGAGGAFEHLGSNLERVVRGSARPILVAARAFRPIRRAVVAYDGGRSTRNAIRFLAERAPAFRDLALEVVLASDDPSSRAVVEAMDWARRELEQAGLAPDCRIVPGEPEPAIAAAVNDRQADLLIMGAYGHSRIRALIVGSTTTALVRTCRVPVLMFR